jgi:hypothetical protein
MTKEELIAKSERALEDARQKHYLAKADYEQGTLDAHVARERREWLDYTEQGLQYLERLHATLLASLTEPPPAQEGAA